MKDNRLKYILVLSLLLNFSFLCAAGYTYYQRNDPSAPFGFDTSRQVPVGSSSIQHHLFEALSLKPDQRKLFEQKAPLFHGTLAKKKNEVDRLRKSLFHLLGKDHPDGKAIEKTIAEINGVQEEIQKMVVAHMLEFKSMLDKDQQKKFFDLIQGAMSKRAIACP
ncbi:MAG: periplasmic heavy metal sensor [Deltaproteobacteria bacterium]|jgi:Spy/CpxP family protein refolding chaperone|nr:periplasmic heavy metal sensor [Deltaproteobacteria bacterium]